MSSKSNGGNTGGGVKTSDAFVKDFQQRTANQQHESYSKMPSQKAAVIATGRGQALGPSLHDKESQQLWADDRARQRAVGDLNAAIDYLDSGETNSESTSKFLDMANGYAKGTKDKELQGYWMQMANDLSGVYSADVYKENRSKYNEAFQELSGLQDAEKTLKQNQKGMQRAVAYGAQGEDVLGRYREATDNLLLNLTRQKELNAILSQLDDELFEKLATDDEKEARAALEKGDYPNIEKLNLGSMKFLYTSLMGKKGFDPNGNGRNKETDLATVQAFYDRVGTKMPAYFNNRDAWGGKLEGTVQSIVGNFISAAGLFDATANDQADILLGNKEATGWDTALGILSGGHYALQGLVAKGRDKLLGAGQEQIGSLNRPEDGSIEALWDAYNNAKTPEERAAIQETLNAGYTSWLKNIGLMQGRVYENSAWLENFSKATTAATGAEEIAALESEYREREAENRKLNKSIREARVIAEKYNGDSPSYWYALRDGTAEERADALLQLGFKLDNEGKTKQQGAESTAGPIERRLMQAAGTALEIGADAAVAGITGGGPAASKFSLGLRVFGGTGKQAIDKGASISQATLYGYAKASAEIITEAMFDFAGGLVYGKSFTGDLAGEIARRLSDNPIFRRWIIKGLNVFGEGAEEGASDFLGIPIEMIIDYNKDQTFWQNLSRLSTQELASFWEDMLMGSFVALLGLPLGDIAGTYKGQVAETYAQDVAKDEEIQGKIEDERDARVANTAKIQGENFDRTAIDKMMDEKAMEAAGKQSTATKIAQKLQVLKYKQDSGAEIAQNELLTKDEFNIAVAAGWVNRNERAQLSVNGDVPTLRDKLEGTTGAVVSKLRSPSKFKGRNRHETIVGTQAQNAETLGYGEVPGKEESHEVATGQTMSAADAAAESESRTAMEEAGANNPTVPGGDAGKTNYSQMTRGQLTKLWQDGTLTYGQYADAMVENGEWTEDEAKAFLDDAARHGASEESLRRGTLKPEIPEKTEGEKRPAKLPDTSETAVSEGERILKEIDENDSHISEDGRPKGDGHTYYVPSRNRVKSLKTLWEEEQKREAQGKKNSRDKEFEKYTDKDGNPLTLQEAAEAEERGEKVNRWRAIEQGVVKGMMLATPEKPLIVGKKWRDHMTAFLFDGTRLRLVHADGWLGRFHVVDDKTFAAGDFEQAAVYLTEAIYGANKYALDESYVKLFRGYKLGQGQGTQVSGPTEVQQGDQTDSEAGHEGGDQKARVFEPGGKRTNPFVTSKYSTRAPYFIGPRARELSWNWERGASYIENMYGGHVYSNSELAFAVNAPAIDLKETFEEQFGAPITYFRGSAITPFWGFVLGTSPDSGTFCDAEDPNLANTVFHENSHRQWKLNGEGISRRETVVNALNDPEAKVKFEDKEKLVYDVLRVWGFGYVNDGTYKTEEEWRNASDADRLNMLNSYTGQARTDLTERLYEEIANIITTEDIAYIDDASSLKGAVPVFRKALVNKGIYTQEQMDLALNAVNEYNAAMKRFASMAPNAVNAEQQVKPISEYDPTIATAFYSIKNPDNKNDKKLIAVRNTSIKSALRAFTQGGMAMPSIGVIKATHGHEDFGNVTFVFSPDVIDPAKNPLNWVYGGDAWTPDYPTVDKKVSYAFDEKGISKIFEPLREASAKAGIPFKEYKLNTQTKKQFIQDMREKYRAAITAAILQDDGYAVDDVLAQYQNYIDMANGMSKFFGKSRFDVSGNVVFDGQSVYVFTPASNPFEDATWGGEEETGSIKLLLQGKVNPHLSDRINDLSDNQKDTLYNELLDLLSPEQKQEVLDWYREISLLNAALDEDNPLSGDQKASMIETVLTLFAKMQLGLTEKEALLTENYIVDDASIKDWINDASYKFFVQKIDNSVFRRNGKPVNNENALELMLEERSRKPGGYSGIPALHPLLSHAFHSITELKEHQDLLTDESNHDLTNADYAEANRLLKKAVAAIERYDSGYDDYAASDKLTEIAQKVANAIDKGIVSDTSLDKIDGIVRATAFNELFGDEKLEFSEKLSTRGIAKESRVKENSKDLSKAIDSISAAFTKIANLPTGYFESKARRIVGPDEIAACILPAYQTISANEVEDYIALCTELRNRGIKVYEYSDRANVTASDWETGELLFDENGDEIYYKSRPEIMKEDLGDYMFNKKEDPKAPGRRRESQDKSDKGTHGEKRSMEGAAQAIDQKLGTGDGTYISNTNEERSEAARQLTEGKTHEETIKKQTEQYERLLKKEKGTWTDEDIVIAQKLRNDFLKAVRDYQMNRGSRMKLAGYLKLAERYNALTLRHKAEKSATGQKLQAEYNLSIGEKILNRAALSYLGFSSDGTFNITNSKNVKIYAAMEDAVSRIGKAVEAKNPTAVAQICKDISDIRGVKRMFGRMAEFASSMENDILSSIAKQDNALEALQTLAYGNLNAMCDDVQPYKALNAAKTIRIMNMLSNMSTIINNVTNNIASGLTSTNALSQWSTQLASKAFEGIAGQPVVAKAQKGWLLNKDIRNAEWEALKMATLVQMYGVNEEGGKLELSGDKGLFNPNSNMFEQTMALYKFFIGMGVEATDQVKSAGLQQALTKGIDDQLAAGKITEAQAEAMRREAKHEVDRLLYKDDNALTARVQIIRDGLNKLKSWGNDDIGTIGLGDIAMAFAKVPANVVRARLLATPEGCLFQVSRYVKGVMKAKRMHSEVLARQIMESHANELAKLKTELQNAYDLNWKEVGKAEKQARIDEIKQKIDALNRQCWNEARTQCSGGVYNKLSKERANYGEDLSFDAACKKCGYADAEEMSQFEMASYSRAIGKAATSAGMVVLGAVLRALGALKDFDNEPDDELRKMYAQKGYKGLMMNLSAIGRPNHEWRDGDNIVSAEFLEVVALPLAIGACAADSAAMAEEGNKGKAFLKSVGYEGLGKAFEAAEDIPGMADAIGFYNAFNNQFKSDNAANGNKLWNSLVTYAAGSIPSFFIPNAATQFGAGMDNIVRDVYNTDNVYQQAWNIMKNKTGYIAGNLLGLRKTIPASVDMWGEERTYGENKFWGVINKTILPGDKFKYRQNKYESEIIRLVKAGYGSAVPKISVSGSFEVGDETYTMNADEKRIYKQNRNTEQAEFFKAFIDSDTYNKLTDAQKEAVFKDLKMECERDAKQTMLNDRGLDVEVTRAKWETELNLNDQIQYLGAKQMAGALWDKSENSVIDFSKMDEFIKGEYKNLSEAQKKILNGSYSHLDDLADAAANGVNSEKWQAAYNIYQTYTEEDENGKRIFKSDLKNSSEMWAKIKRATGFSDGGKQMKWIQEHMELTFTGSPNTSTYDELIYDYGVSRESAAKIYNNFSTIKPTKGYSDVQDRQKWVGLTQCGLSDKEQWDSFFAMVPSNNTKQIANMKKLQGQTNPDTGKKYTFQEAIHKLKLDVIYWKEVLPNGKEKKHEIKE